MQFDVTVIYLTVFCFPLLALSCPTNCACSSYSNGVRVNCNNKGLTNVPTDFPEDSYSIDLQNNVFTSIESGSFQNLTLLYTLDCDYGKLTAIKSGAFRELPALYNLYLRSNEIAVIEVNAFDDLPSLRYIYLSSNNLTTIGSGVFQNLPRLYHIDLMSNKLTVVESGAFQDLPSLSTINLENNKVSMIEDGAFVNVFKSSCCASLNLNHNNISKLQDRMFEGYTNIYYIYLRYNNFKSIMTDAFKGLRTSYLYLENNGISVIEDGAFSNMSISYLYLSNNNISVIEDGGFANVFTSRCCQRLYLDHNNLSKLQGRMFGGLKYPYYVYLRYNNFTSIMTDTFEGLDVTYLYLENNEISVLEDGAFSNLLYLYRLHLDNNEIVMLKSGAFRNLSSLYTLYLDNNEIVMLKSGAFRNLPSLYTLNLENNNISVIEDGAFANAFMSSCCPSLNLDYNNISKLQGRMFGGQKFPYSVYLRYNNVTSIMTDTFEGLDVNYLDLRGNNVSLVMNGTFELMPRLNNLYLELECDCNKQHFWQWIRSVQKFVTTITCLDRDGAYFAHLPQCFFDACSVGSCTYGFCENGGTCYIDNYGNPTCSCRGDWTGSTCSVSPCYNNPCSNNGLCTVDGNGRARCSCIGNWTGMFCQNSPCETVVCGDKNCYYNDSGLALCFDPLAELCQDTTTEEPTTEVITTETPTTTTISSTTTTPTTTPCTLGSSNRTNVQLDEDCGIYGDTGRCTSPNSACTGDGGVWKCRCNQGYAKKNGICTLLPKGLFDSTLVSLTIEKPENTPTGQQLLNLKFTEVAGFHKINANHSIVGSHSSLFLINNPNTAEDVTVVLNGKLKESKYDIFLVVSVTIEKVVVQDYVHVSITVTKSDVIRHHQNVVILDGMPNGTVIGQVCPSCPIGGGFTVSNEDIITVNEQGNIVTTKLVSLDILQAKNVLAYSHHVTVEKQSFIANLTVTVVRTNYLTSLNEDSGATTKVASFNLRQNFEITDTTFNINNQMLLLGSTLLDFMTVPEYLTKFGLRIGGLDIIDISVTIKVIDINDKAPQFQQHDYSFFAIQSAYPDLIVGVVHADDQDSFSNLTYSIKPKDKLTIDQQGVIRITTPLTVTNYYATVIVDDTFYTDSANVSIKILQPTNTHLNETFRGSISENQLATSPIVTVFVNGYEHFEFADHTAYGFFNLDLKKGNITNTRKFDRENPSENHFKYTVVATRENEATCSLVVLGQVIITVTDVNDESPEFINTPYKANVPEEKNNSQLTMNFPVSTTDKDENPTVTFSILSPKDSFFISQTGIISTIKPLDRETASSLDVVVKASDGANENTTRVIVTVDDINDNNPQFNQGSYSFTVNEDAAPGTAVGIVYATDEDEDQNAKITYDLVDSYFRINQTTGEITVSGNLDRESMSHHTITVFARDNGENIRSATVSVTIKVLDVNDNSPEFNQDEIVVDAVENTTCTNPITTIIATDLDEPGTVNSRIQYSIISGGENNFVLTNGELKCVNMLDYEEMTSVTLIVQASDSSPTDPRKSNQTVVIKIKDVNDNSPVFNDNKSTLNIRYFSSNDRVIEVFTATDLDSGENGRVIYSINGTAAVFLKIDSTNGKLVTNSDISEPANADYVLNVIATDNGIPALQSIITLTVTVTNDIQQTISFKEQEIEMTIIENKAIGTELGNLSSHVKNDVGATLRYEILNDNLDLKFSVNGNDGKVTLKNLVDREQKDRHEFVVRVKVASNAAQSDLALVKVQVSDENDNKPIFVRPSPYVYQIKENAAVGARVTPVNIKIVATDADIGENALIKFSLSGSSACISAFNLGEEDSNTRYIQLTQKVDYESQKSCQLNVQAFNPNNITMSSTVSAHITILDYNDNPPEFLDQSDAANSLYLVTVREDTTINDNIPPFGLLRDKDSRENGEIVLSVVNNIECQFDVFKVDNRIQIKVKSSSNLDYDSGIRMNNCSVRASDKGSPSLSATAKISVKIIDVNDNSPVIYNPQININISREVQIGTIILNTIPASDMDSGENAALQYIIRQSEHSSLFTINPNNGAISVNSPLTSVQKDIIKLDVVVADKGLPPRSSVAKVTITIQDDNPRPYFDDPGPIHIQEHTPQPGGLIYQGKAFDRSGEEIVVCDCTFEIDAGNKKDVITLSQDSESRSFSIKFKYSNMTLDREKEANGKVGVIVQATDKGTPPKKSEWKLFMIIIDDINDQSPVFAKSEYHFSVFQKAPDGVIIGTVMADDKDLNPVTHYNISVTEGSFPSSVVSINTLSGEIYKSGNMTLERNANLQIKGLVSAQDGKDDTKEPSFSQVTITIEFDDKNNHTPIFEKAEYEKEISWNTAIATSILQVIAMDEDVGQEGEITYSIKMGNTREFFKINSDGIIMLAYKLDSSIGTAATEIVELTVQAIDGGIIPKSSNTTVRIRITGDNPGVCVQGAEHSRQVNDLESERNSWSSALYGLVAALCLTILCALFFLYKWRSIPTDPDISQPKDKGKYFDSPMPYSDLEKRQTVEYSTSNDAFEPPTNDYDDPCAKIEETSRFRPQSGAGPALYEPAVDYPVYEWETKETKVLPSFPTSFRPSS